MARTQGDADGATGGTDGATDRTDPETRGTDGETDRTGPETRGTDAATADSGSDATPALSVVVVTRNEADRIEACLDSVFAACEQVTDFEVILVDSRSTDGTVNLAVEYPISVLQLPSAELCTPAAGRFVGTRHASADRILFVDGDMVVRPDWVTAALGALEDPDVAAVDGWLNDAGAETRREVDAVRGVALYDADALAAVGGFDPSLQALEDVHLGLELTGAGYRLLRLPRVAASHPERPPVVEPFRRLRRGYAHGLGQVLRTSVSQPKLLARHLLRERYRLFVWLWLFVGLVAGRRRRGRQLWACLSGLGFCYVARQLGPVDALTFAVEKVVVTLGIPLGASVPVASAEAFPLEDVAVLREGPVHDEAAVTGGGERS